MATSSAEPTTRLPPVGRGPVGEGFTQPEVLAQRGTGVLDAVHPAFLQFRDEEVDDVVEAVRDEVRRDVEAVDRAVPHVVGELVGQAGRSADVPALRAERDDGLAQRPAVHVCLRPPFGHDRTRVGDTPGTEGAVVLGDDRILLR